jgi:hypothetical protein
MKSHTEYIWMNTKDRYEIVNITNVFQHVVLCNDMHIVK